MHVFLPLIICPNYWLKPLLSIDFNYFLLIFKILLNASVVMKIFISFDRIPANIYLFKENNRSTRKRHEICSNLTIKTLERRH